VANETDQKAITADAQPARQLTGADFAVDNPRRIGLLIFFLVFGVFGVWASVAPLDSAAHASGVVTVRSNKKLIQHLEGGIVSQILAQNGDMVAAGQPLLVLDNTQSLAQLEIANAQYAAYKALEARLLAERDGLEQVVYPQSLSAVGGDAQAEMAAQDQVFNARRASLQGAVTVLEQRIEQLQARVLGMRALLESKQELATSFTEELNDVRELLAEGFSDRNRLRELERRAATLRGEAAELSATISSTEMQIGETRLQILQQEKDFRNEVVNLLSETQTRLRDVNERMTALRDIVSRTVIAAPEAGIVNGLQVHTIGGVVTPGNPIAEIIPYADELIIESRISPNDIDRVAVDQLAKIRFSSFNSAVPSIEGRVIHLSADAFTDPSTGATYYTARVEVTAEGLTELGDLLLVPGMPAEVFIATGSRTMMQYLMKPISNALARSLIED
jgi:membrane fusion protein, epimerase transport system